MITEELSSRIKCESCTSAEIRLFARVATVSKHVKFSFSAADFLL